MHKLFYSSLCPDTPEFVAKLKEKHIVYEAIEITSSMASLKQFLAFRDQREEFESIKEKGAVGIPCLLTIDDQIILNISQLNEVESE